MPLGNYTPLDYDGVISYPGYDIDEEIGACMTQSSGFTSLESSLDGQHNQDYIQDSNAADMDFISDNLEVPAPEYVSDSDEDQEIICYGMVSSSITQ